MTTRDAAAPPSLADRALVPGTALLAAIQLLLAAWMVVDPRSFFDQVGTFGAYNVHYIGDAAAFNGGIGLALAAAVAWPPLRSGVLVAAAAVIGLHAINHWFDVNAANGDSNADVFAAVSLTLQFVLTAGLARAALERRTA